MFRFSHARWLVVLSLLVDLAACSSDAPTPGAGNAGSPTGTAGSLGATGGAGMSGGSAVGGGGSSAGSLATMGGGGAGGSGGSTGGAGAGGSSAGAAGAAGTAGAAGASGAGGSGGGSSNAFTGTAKLMVLGSSNELQTCWRALFWKKLKDASIDTFDMVGGVTDGPDCGVAGYDKDLQAQNGIIVTDLTAQQFAGWFSAHPPDAVLVHFGGADLLANKPIPGIISAYSLALEQARLVSPQVRFLIAQHTPEDSAGCNDCPNTVPQLNSEITAWAATKTQPTSPVVVVDLYTGVDPAVDTSDGIHLNVAGSTKVAARFFDAIKPYFGK